jgi:hypothetical protein
VKADGGGKISLLPLASMLDILMKASHALGPPPVGKISGTKLAFKKTGRYPDLVGISRQIFNIFG